jgi:hypothetical protein
MIHFTSKADSSLRPEALSGQPLRIRISAQESAGAERLSASSQATLQSVLRSQPELRPEVVERGRQLVVDGNYPSKEIVRRLSEILVNSIDLSEQTS